jgi:hypothetical protein
MPSLKEMHSDLELIFSAAGRTGPDFGLVFKDLS